MAKAAKEMERAQEKAMSVEYGLREKGKAVEIVSAQEKEKAPSLAQAVPEKAKERERSRGMSLGR